MQQVARYEGIANHVSEFIIRATSCTLRGNRESRIGVIIRASRCTLRGNRGLRIEVESFVQQVARYEGIANHVSEFIIRATSCTLRGNRESRIGVIIRASRCTLRGNRGLRIEVESFVQQVARYKGIVNYVSGLNLSCIKMHATFEMNNALDG